MKKFFKMVGFVLLFALVVIQFFPKNYPANLAADENDIVSYHHVPEDVAKILETSCYDCHSNQVTYPWYSYVAPVSFLMSHDIHEGKEELNFSEWGKYEKKRMIKKLDEIAEEVEEGEMPLPIYQVIHGNARLSEEQREKLVEWAEKLTEEIMK